MDSKFIKLDKKYEKYFKIPDNMSLEDINKDIEETRKQIANLVLEMMEVEKMEEYINENLEKVYNTNKIEFLVEYLEPRHYRIKIKLGNEIKAYEHIQDNYMTFEENFDIIRYNIDKLITNFYKKLVYNNFII